jgi:uncharacterized protein DUF4185/uncharacterized protein DUF5005
MPRRIRFLALVSALALSLAWSPARAETAAEHLQRLLWTYGDTGIGWTGADGTYSVPLPDGRVVWLFSDTFLGPVNADHSRPTSAPFINNSMIVQDGDNLTTLAGPYNRSLIVPPDGVGFYWVGDGVVQNADDGVPDNEKLLVFVMRFVAAPIPFAFQQVGTDLATFSLPSLGLEGITRMPLAFSPGIGAAPVAYGSAVMTTGGYHYLYGVEDIHTDKYLHLARVPAGHLLDGTWEFWGAAGWSIVPALSLRILSGIANELSVSSTPGGYMLVAQDHAIGKNIVKSTASLPEGPWSPPASIFTTPESAGNILTYNAKAHEQLSSPGKIVVSYNVNSAVVADVYADVDNYRPRFVEITV